MDLRNKIFSTDDISKELVEVPEWGVTIQLRSMTALERSLLTDGSMKNDKVDIARMYALTVIATVYDPETGLPLFTNEDKEAILSKNGSIIERLATKALGTSGLTEKAVDEAGERFPTKS